MDGEQLGVLDGIDVGTLVGDIDGNDKVGNELGQIEGNSQ